MSFCPCVGAGKWWNSTEEKVTAVVRNVCLINDCKKLEAFDLGVRTWGKQQPPREGL